MAGLFWTFIIWFARTMKRKSKEQYKKQEERMPEMESVTEEERCYICEKLVDYTEAKNVFWWIMIFLNLFFVIICAGKTINMGINGEAFSLFSNICMLSLFIGITYLCHSMRTYLIEEKRLYEKGELKKDCTGKEMWFFQSGCFLWSNRRKKYGKYHQYYFSW